MSARDVKRPASQNKADSLQSRMKKRDAGAGSGTVKCPKQKVTKNAFAGSRDSGPAAKKALDRGNNSSKKKVASKPAKRKTDAAPKRKAGADKHKTAKRDGNASRKKDRGKAKATRGGGKRERR